MHTTVRGAVVIVVYVTQSIEQKMVNWKKKIRYNSIQNVRVGVSACCHIVMTDTY